MRVEAVPDATPGPGEVLIKVAATAVNRADCMQRQGNYPPPRGASEYMGLECSGTVAALGDGVTLYEVGQPVFCMPRFPHPAQAYAQYVAAPTRHFARRPDCLDVLHAAGLPLAGLTAWQALVDTGGVRSGQRVLVHAAGGGVGHLAVQIAKARGAHVVAVAGAGKHALLHELGADEVLDRARLDWTGIAPVQVVLDPVGGDTTARSLDLLAPGSTLVRLPVWTAEDAPVRARAVAAGQRAVRLLVEPDLGGLTALAAVVERGLLRVHVDAVYDLARAARAHTHVEAGHTTGKVVLRVPQDAPSGVRR